MIAIVRSYEKTIIRRKMMNADNLKTLDYYYFFNSWVEIADEMPLNNVNTMKSASYRGAFFVLIYGVYITFYIIFIFREGLSIFMQNLHEKNGLTIIRFATRWK